MNIILELTVSGILLGGIYSLLSVGLTLVFGVVRVVNFAHGEFMMIGMYGSYFAWSLWGVNPYVMVIPMMGATFVLGLIVYFAIIRRTIGGNHLTQVFATLGLGILLQNLALIAFTGNPRTVRVESLSGVLEFGAISIPKNMMISFIVAASLTLLLWLYLHWTLTGSAIRGMAQNRVAATLVGINVNRLYALTFGLGTASVGAAGVLLSPIYSVYPRVGFDFLLVAFVIVVLGGLGSVIGAALASFGIAIVTSFVGYYAGPSEAQLAYFVVFVLVLAFRPSGLFGKRGAQEYA